jgi:hypothetical protein
MDGLLHAWAATCRLTVMALGRGPAEETTERPEASGSFRRIRPPATPSGLAPYVPPRNELEEEVAAIIGEMLDVSAVGALSQPPLDAAQWAALRLRIEVSCGVTLPWPALIEESTVSGVARLIAETAILDARPEELGEVLAGIAREEDLRRVGPLPAGSVESGPLS